MKTTKALLRIIKARLHYLFITLALLAGINQVAAQGAQFFRIAGPVATTITALSADGYVTWTNSPTNATFTVQTAQSLLSPTNWVDYIQVPVINTITTERIYDPSPPSGMGLIPAGSFTMGDTLDGLFNAIPTNIYVSSFFMDVNLVNYGLWANVYAYAGSHGYNFMHSGSNGGTGTNYPVEMVDWFDCVKWCNARSQQTGLTPCYYTDAGFTQVFTNGDNNTTVYQNLIVNGYRLPTEAEWEKAARGGLSGQRFPWGNLISAQQAQYQATTGFGGYDLGTNTNYLGASPVGSFDLNGYGLYDMAGNVMEWCWDWYGTPYGQPTTTNPTGAGPTFVGRVFRGGYWNGNASYARCANRNAVQPYIPNGSFGFRCVRGS